MSVRAEASPSEPPVAACWCCAGEFGEISLVRLGAHPEVAVCLDCARYLRRRAVARQDEHRRGLSVLVRRGVKQVRGWVIAHGWHERGPLGAFLRRLDRFLP